jgi:K+-transporting ATPase KdpF subunit
LSCSGFLPRLAIGSEWRAYQMDYLIGGADSLLLFVYLLYALLKAEKF